MSLELTKFTRKPLNVDGVQVTVEHMDDIAEWCGGKVRTLPPNDRHTQEALYIQVPVKNAQHPRQSKAFVGDYVLFANGGYKVYTSRAFKRHFELVDWVGWSSKDNPDNSTERV